MSALSAHLRRQHEDRTPREVLANCGETFVICAFCNLPFLNGGLLLHQPNCRHRPIEADVGLADGDVSNQPQQATHPQQQPPVLPKDLPIVRCSRRLPNRLVNEFISLAREPLQRIHQAAGGSNVVALLEGVMNFLNLPKAYLNVSRRGGKAGRRPFNRQLRAMGRAAREALGKVCPIQRLQVKTPTTAACDQSQHSHSPSTNEQSAGETASMRTRRRLGRFSSIGVPSAPVLNSMSPADRFQTVKNALSRRKFVMRFDGGARSDTQPKVAGAGFCIFSSASDSPPILTGNTFLGYSHTNNFAEYAGLIRGMQLAVSAGISQLDVFGDSELVIKQMNDTADIHSQYLLPLHLAARTLARQFSAITFRHKLREFNTHADLQANIAMDRGLGSNRAAPNTTKVSVSTRAPASGLALPVDEVVERLGELPLPFPPPPQTSSLVRDIIPV